MELTKLKGVLTEKKKTYAEVAEAIGLSTTGFANKINGRSSFNANEMRDIIEYLEISANDINDIFMLL